MSKEGQFQSDMKQYQMPNALKQKKDTHYRNSSTGIDTEEGIETLNKSKE
ncbi:hypothetical protein [Bacillus sp. FJAT-49736]|nr:hypothetical protein [Bacillus sp. FJAT-49736]MBS4172257.1 hypothetical protein [Bacillus sp. FJAT-49736]